MPPERLKIFGDLPFFEIIGNFFKYKLDARLRGHDGVERCHSREACPRRRSGSGNPVRVFILIGLHFIQDLV